MESLWGYVAEIFLFFQDDLILTMERPMNQIFKATSVAIFSFLFSLTVFADNHMEAPQDAALEIYQCNFSDNLWMTPEKLLQNGINGQIKIILFHAGYLMTPYYQRKSDFPYDLFWLGVTEDFTSLGQAQDECLLLKEQN